MRRAWNGSSDVYRVVGGGQRYDGDNDEEEDHGGVDLDNREGVVVVVSGDSYLPDSADYDDNDDEEEDNGNLNDLVDDYGSSDENDEDDEESGEAGYTRNPPAPMSPSQRFMMRFASSISHHQNSLDEPDYYELEQSSSGSFCRVAAVMAAIVAIMAVAVLALRRPFSMPWSSSSSSTGIGGADGGGGTGGWATNAGSCTRRDEIMVRRYYARSTLDSLANGAVASDHALCSQVGTDVLSAKGGNAVDAAVAVALCLGVANPGSSGMGGGAFLLVHADPKANAGELLQDLQYDDFRDPPPGAAPGQPRGLQSASGKETTVIDSREVAPGAATATMYDNGGGALEDTPPSYASLVGGLAAGVPGELRGLELAHRLYGKLPWRDVVEPVARLATKGVEVNENLAKEIAYMASTFKTNNDVGAFKDYGLRALLTRGDSWDRPLREKELLQNQKLGELLQSVADRGADALYVDMAESLALDVQSAGGILTAQDIRNYRPALRSPVFASDVHGFTVVGVPPPSSGGAAVIGAARFLAGYAVPFATFADTLSVHLLSEALKHMYAIRMSLSDPAYNNATVKAAVRDMTKGSYMELLRNATLENSTLPLSQYGGRKWAQLEDSDGNTNATDAQEGDRKLRKARRSLLRPLGYLNDAGTSHFSIVDKDGNSVAMTTSVNTYFGSTVVSKSTGIVLGNTMDDFSSPGTPNYFGLRPSEANYIAPGKKPLSSMSPTMVFRSASDGATIGDLILVIGASGGPKIISAVLQVLVLVLFQGNALFESVVHPRIHDQLLYHGSAVTTFEESTLADGNLIAVSERTRDALLRRNHQLVDIDYMGTVQAIAIDSETSLLTATCDVRKGGSPAGY
jgi:gamma-glutamyltranspeptidase